MAMRPGVKVVFWSGEPKGCTEARRTEEIAGGSHAIGVSRREAVAAMIGEAVEATSTVQVATR
jgi:hypothetical protein